MNLAPALRTWLLQRTDPSVRVRVLTELLDRNPSSADVLRARAQIGRKGWAAEILKLQLPAGNWDAPSVEQHYRPKYIVTNWRLIVLAELGMTRDHPGIARAVRGVMRLHRGPGGDLGGRGSEVCYTGNAVRMFTRFGYFEHPMVQSAIAWLLRAQKADGGWNCYPVRTGTLDGWEAMAAFAAVPEDRRSVPMQRAIARGAEFYLARRLLREGRPAYAPWRRLHFPTHYYYDVLVGLDMLTRLGYADDRRLGPALDILESKRNSDGSWNTDADHPDIPPEDPYQPSGPYYPFVIEPAGRPGRWITTTALTVLRRAGRL